MSNENSIINTPEFWERVKREYKPESHPDGCSALCANSQMFTTAYGSILVRGEIKANARVFLEQGEFDWIEIGYMFLFIGKHRTVSRGEMRAVRHAFIEYMLEKTKKDLQEIK
jgi:hypothetical protein